MSQSIHEERTPSSEAVIAPGTDPSRDALQVFLDQVGRHPLLAPWEEVQLAKRIEEGDEAARERMITANLRLVVSLARRGHRGRSDLSLLDLIQDGIVGLIVAVERFDWRRGCRFSTYACWWIRQTMDRGTTGQIGVPFHLREAGRRLDAAEHRLEKQLGRRPTEDELAAATGLAANRVARVRENLSRTAVVSLDSSPDDADGTLGDRLAAETDVFEEASAAEEQEVLQEAIDQLPEKSRQVVTLRFGLRGHEPLSLREVGRRFGLSSQRIGQIEKQALAALGRTLGVTSNGDGEPQWRERVRDFFVVLLPEALRFSLPQNLSVGVATGVVVAAGGAALVSPGEPPGPLDQGPAVVEVGELEDETSDKPAKEAPLSGDVGTGGSVPVVDARAGDVRAGEPPALVEMPSSGEAPAIAVAMPASDMAPVDDASVAASFAGEEIQSDQVEAPDEAAGHSGSDDQREDVSDESADEVTNPPGHGGSPPGQDGSSGQDESTLGEDGSSGQGEPTPGEDGSSGEDRSQPGQDGSPGHSGSSPGHGGSPPGQGETPPGREEGSAGKAKTDESELEGAQPPAGDAETDEPESDESSGEQN